ncbi:MAG: hypothetical protein LBH17_00090 [Oscillospiraceae bacterium]|jgi:hypothetical protein|nr:hypothetical protein [Oscillospiraceae bacterium]
MKKHAFKTLTLVLALVMAFVIGVPASAGQLRASRELASCTVTMYADGNGKVTAEFTTVAVGVADEVGATKVVIQRKVGSSWVTAQTFTRSSYNNLIGQNRISYSNEVTHNGTAGQQYRAIVTAYAKIGSGSTSDDYTTNTVIAT